MNIDDIKELIKQGFTHDEIMTLVNFKTEVKEPEVKEPEVKEPEVKEPEVKEPEIKEPEVKEPEVKEPETLNNETVDKFISAVDKLTKTIQLSNLKSAFSESSGEDINTKAINALETVLNPIFNKKKGE